MLPHIFIHPRPQDLLLFLWKTLVLEPLLLVRYRVRTVVLALGLPPPSGRPLLFLEPTPSGAPLRFLEPALSSQPLLVLEAACPAVLSTLRPSLVKLATTPRAPDVVTALDVVDVVKNSTQSYAFANPRVSASPWERIVDVLGTHWPVLVVFGFVMFASYGLPLIHCGIDFVRAYFERTLVNNAPPHAHIRRRSDLGLRPMTQQAQQELETYLSSMLEAVLDTSTNPSMAMNDMMAVETAQSANDTPAKKKKKPKKQNPVNSTLPSSSPPPSAPTSTRLDNSHQDTVKPQLNSEINVAHDELPLAIVPADIANVANAVQDDRHENLVSIPSVDEATPGTIKNAQPLPAPSTLQQDGLHSTPVIQGTAQRASAPTPVIPRTAQWTVASATSHSEAVAHSSDNDAEWTTMTREGKPRLSSPFISFASPAARTEPPSVVTKKSSAKKQPAVARDELLKQFIRAPQNPTGLPAPTRTPHRRAVAPAPRAQHLSRTGPTLIARAENTVSAISSTYTSTSVSTSGPSPIATARAPASHAKSWMTTEKGGKQRISPRFISSASPAASAEPPSVKDVVTKGSSATKQEPSQADAREDLLRKLIRAPQNPNGLPALAPTLLRRAGAPAPWAQHLSRTGPTMIARAENTAATLSSTSTSTSVSTPRPSTIATARAPAKHAKSWMTAEKGGKQRISSRFISSASPAATAEPPSVKEFVTTKSSTEKPESMQGDSRDGLLSKLIRAPQNPNGLPALAPTPRRQAAAPAPGAQHLSRTGPTMIPRAENTNGGKEATGQLTRSRRK